MTRGVKVKKRNANWWGGELIPKEAWAMGPKEQELDLEVYAGDYLDVLADVELV